MDAEQIKNRQRDTWRAASHGWKKYDQIVTEGSRPVAERLLDMVRLQAGHRLLDIASGTGEPALTAAERVGPSGYVLGTDLVEEMLEYARDKANAKGHSHLEFRVVDGEMLDLEPSSFDAVTCRWGLMFMPDPVGCLRRAYQALKPGGRVAVATWAEPARNPFATLPMSVVMKHTEVPKPSPGAPGIFGISDPDRLRSILEDAGFSEVEVGEVEVTLIEAESGKAYWGMLREIAGPITAIINGLEESVQARVHQEIEEAAQAIHDGESVKGTGVALTATGRR